MPKDRVVTLTFDELHIDSSRNCEQSSLQVFDGPDTFSATLGEKMCGILTTEKMESTGSEIFMTYTSSSLNFTDQFVIGYNVSGNLLSIYRLLFSFLKNFKQFKSILFILAFVPF